MNTSFCVAPSPLDSSSVSKLEKRRGRKRERDDKYFSKAQNRIVELRKILVTAKDDGLTVKER